MAKFDPFNSPPEPIRIGLLSDVPPLMNRLKQMAAELVRSEYAGRTSRPIEFVHIEHAGAPIAPLRNTVDGFRSLVDQNCLIVVGGNHSDNCRVVLDVADELKTPFISLGASEGLVSEYGFSVGWGAIPHDAHLLANWCKAKGFNRITVTADHAWHMEEYLRHLTVACKRYGIQILSVGRLSDVRGDQQNADAKRIVAEHRAMNPDAIVSFGSGSSSYIWMLAVHEAGWDVPRAMNANFFWVTQPPGEKNIVPPDILARPEFWEAREGWEGISTVDDDNRVLSGAAAKFKAMFGEEPFLMDAFANYYDAMRVAHEAIADAHLLSGEGVLEALERIKFLPAACGGASTVISFGAWDRVGIKGKDPYVMRRMVKGENLMGHRFDTSL